MGDQTAMEKAQAALQGRQTSAVAQGATVVQMQASQFVTAMQVQVPRNKKDVLEAVLEEARLLADQFYYHWSVKNKDGSRGEVEGMSIEGAMAVAREYRNCATYAETVSESPTHWEFRGVFLDLETGFTSIRSFRQRKNTGKKGRFDQDRLEDINFQIGQSKAVRNAIDKGAPRWLTRRAMAEAKKAAANELPGNGHEAKVNKFIASFKKWGVEVTHLEERLAKRWDDWTDEDFATLIGIGTAIKDGQTTPDNEFMLAAPSPADEDQIPFGYEREPGEEG